MVRRLRSLRLLLLSVLMLGLLAGNLVYVQPASAEVVENAVQTEANPVPDHTLRVHYQRADNQYGDMGLWLWGDVSVTSEQAGIWPVGASSFSDDQLSSHGAYVDIPIKENAVNIYFIVVNKITGEKEADQKNVTLISSQLKEVWINEGSDVVSLSAPYEQVDNSIRIYYERADLNYDDWGLWMWDDVATPSEATGTWPTGAVAFSNSQTDNHGAYVDVAFNENAQKISFIVVNRTTGDKDGDGRTFSELNEYQTIYLKEGNPSVYTTPYVVERVSTANFPEWSQDSTIYEVNVRQYTEEGTFKAFEEHLPRLKELGVEILWMMPIHPISDENRIGSLGSYYAVGDYKGVNSEFGTLEDFKHLVDTAHEMGFKVMLDWVANHTGWDNEWIDNPGWYVTDSNGNIVSPNGWNDVAELNFDNANMRAAMIDAMAYWVREADIDGYRADFASGVPQDFWEAARQELDAIKPVYMLAEDDSQHGLLEKAFNSNYNWDLFYNITAEIPTGEIHSSDVKRYLDNQMQKYPKGAYPMNYITNHDINSWEGSTSEMLGDAEDMLAAFSFTLPGMPLIYSGQEADLNKRLEFFEKDEIDWSNLSNQTLYKQLVQIKKDNPALWNGSAGGEINYLTVNDESVLAFEREKDGNKVMVILNLSGTERQATVQAGDLAGSYHNYFALSRTDITPEHQVTLEPWGYQIFTSNDVDIEPTPTPTPTPEVVLPQDLNEPQI